MHYARHIRERFSPGHMHALSGPVPPRKHSHLRSQMYLLPLTAREQKHRHNIVNEIKKLVDDLSRPLYLDMQRLALMRHFDGTYSNEHFGLLASNCIQLNVYCMQLKNQTLDYRKIWGKWLELRSIFAKYLGEDDPNIRRIDRLYTRSHIFRTLPDFKHVRRPDRQLPRVWWDEHLDQLQSLNNMALWWGNREAGPLEFDDLKIPQSIERPITTIEGCDSHTHHISAVQSTQPSHVSCLSAITIPFFIHSGDGSAP
jgi:hypothetical protein